MSDARRCAKGGEVTTFWLLLALSIAGFAGQAVIFTRQWRAMNTGDLGAFSSSWLTLLANLLVLAAWVLAIVLAVRLRRWGWLVACVLLLVFVPIFAVAMLIDSRTTAADRQRQASFDEAMAQALAEQEAEGSQGGM